MNVAVVVQDSAGGRPSGLGQASSGRQNARLRGLVGARVLQLLGALAMLALILATSGCATPEILKPDEDSAPVFLTDNQGLSTRELVYRGWDHCIRVSDGSVEMIYVPSIGRLMRFAPIEAGTGTATTASTLANTAVTDDKNLCWINPRWTGINPSPLDLPVREHPRDYPLYGGLRQWCGPQEKWPPSRVPDSRKLIDVEVPWPPDPGSDLTNYKFIQAEAGSVRFESVTRSAGGLRANFDVTAQAPNKGVLNFCYGQTNMLERPVEACSWATLMLRTHGYLAVRRDQLKAEPALWPAGSSFAGPWAILPLDSRPEGPFELALEPAPDATAHVVVLHEQSIYSLQVKREPSVPYPAGRTVMTVKRGVIGCPAQVELVDPESEEHYEVGACSPLKVLGQGETVELNLRLVSKPVKDFDLEQLKTYLMSAVATESLPGMPDPHVAGTPGVTTGPTRPLPVHKPEDTLEYPPPLPDNAAPPPAKPPTPPPATKPPPADPNKPPTLGPVNG